MSEDQPLEAAVIEYNTKVQTEISRLLQECTRAISQVTFPTRLTFLYPAAHDSVVKELRDIGAVVTSDMNSKLIVLESLPLTSPPPINLNQPPPPYESNDQKLLDGDFRVTQEKIHCWPFLNCIWIVCPESTEISKSFVKLVFDWMKVTRNDIPIIVLGLTEACVTNYQRGKKRAWHGHTFACMGKYASPIESTLLPLHIMYRRADPASLNSKLCLNVEP